MKGQKKVRKVMREFKKGKLNMAVRLPEGVVLSCLTDVKKQR